MPINKPAAISAALILAISSAVQAQTDFNFNRIPAAERQRMLQEAVAEINGGLPSTSYDGSNQLNRVFIENNRLVFDSSINLDKLNTPPEARRPEILQALFQVSGSKQLCEISVIKFTVASKLFPSMCLKATVPATSANQSCNGLKNSSSTIPTS